VDTPFNSPRTFLIVHLIMRSSE